MKRICFLLVMFVLVFGCGVVSANDEQEIVNSFQNIAQKHIESYDYNPRFLAYLVDHNNGEKPYWIKSKNTIVGGYSIDVQKTNSLVSPYIGTVDFASQIWVSGKFETKEEAEGATEFKESGKPDQVRITMAYQNGVWVVKKYQFKSATYPRWEEAKGKMLSRLEIIE